MPEAYPLVTVGALVIGPSQRGLFVRTRKWRGLWGVPGGKVHYGERLEAALRRELAEETGLALSRIFRGPVQEAIDSPEFHRPAHMILLNFVAHSEREDVQLNEEADAYVWLPPDEALAFNLNEPTRHLVQFYLDHRTYLEVL